LNGYKVVYIPFIDGHPSAPPEDVVTGFIDGDKARGRPVGLAVDSKGALLIADDTGNSIWRVSATSP
jgi:glucose/arabinose dehydrogenase